MTNFKRLSKILEAIFMPLVFLTALYFIVAAIIGWYLPDAARALAVSVGLWYLSTLNCEPNSLSHGSRLIKRMAKGTGNFLFVNIYEKPYRALSFFFLLLLTTHGIWGMSLQQGFGYDITFFVQAAYNSFHPQAPFFK